MNTYHCHQPQGKYCRAYIQSGYTKAFEAKETSSHYSNFPFVFSLLFFATKKQQRNSQKGDTLLFFGDSENKKHHIVNPSSIQ